ncbi:MAG TPA: RNA-binding protein [Sulfuricaulis sp.]|jgi:RNA recognition motif-containing protein|nr:RNA-binding protein [Sulfuricaulis sp.]
MGRKIYVGNLPYSANPQSLEEKFSRCGTVDSVNVITDRDSGQSKGFGFIEMSSDAEAQKAIEEFNGADFDGRPLTVNEAKPQQKKSGFGDRRRQGGGRSRW